MRVFRSPSLVSNLLLHDGISDLLIALLSPIGERQVDLWARVRDRDNISDIVYTAFLPSVRSFQNMALALYSCSIVVLVRVAVIVVSGLSKTRDQEDRVLHTSGQKVQHRHLHVNSTSSSSYETRYLPAETLLTLSTASRGSSTSLLTCWSPNQVTFWG